ncbi:hypothetical protein HGRIS_011143 [Hohenbuehelia grisea]|uniref:Uncharacterized protein n=1 Tax=Hohenbuehelia grisea TaxID=104357 RepID=A0ABR3IZ32_9AGAR
MTHMFIFRDPKTPKRLDVSRLYHSDANPNDRDINALYSSVCFMKVATDPRLRERFMQKIRSFENTFYRAGFDKEPNIFRRGLNETSCVDIKNRPVAPQSVAAPPSSRLPRAAKTSSAQALARHVLHDLHDSTNSDLDSVHQISNKEKLWRMRKLRSEQGEKARAKKPPFK